MCKCDMNYKYIFFWPQFNTIKSKNQAGYKFNPHNAKIETNQIWEEKCYSSISWLQFLSNTVAASHVHFPSYSSKGKVNVCMVINKSFDTSLKFTIGICKDCK